MVELADPQIWLSLLTLTVLEIVLGIDNIVFIAVLTQKLPPERQASARRLGIAMALITRLMLLFAIAWVIGLTAPLFELFGHSVSWRDIILIAGGGFLIYKATREIHDGLEGQEGETTARAAASFAGVVAQTLRMTRYLRTPRRRRTDRCSTSVSRPDELVRPSSGSCWMVGSTTDKAQTVS